MIDFARLLPYALAALAIAIAVGWFVAHDRAVAAKAVATDRAGAAEVILAAQQKSLDDKQKVIDYADELSKVRAAELQAAQAANRQYSAALAALAKDPDVARVLDTRLPESVRQLRRAGAAPGAGDGLRVLQQGGVHPADTGAAVPGPDRGRAAGGEPGAAGRAPVVQPGQSQGPAVDRPAASNKAGGFHWPNFLNWFTPEPRSAP